MTTKIAFGLAATAVAMTAASAAYADKLDDVLSEGTVRCAVVLELRYPEFADSQKTMPRYARPLEGKASSE
jgi:hypothetical protein